MTIQWRYEQFGEVGLMAVTGYLGEDALARFKGAIDWISTRAATVVLDLSDLQGWSDAGQEAVAAAAGQLADRHRVLELAGISTDREGTHRWGNPDERLGRLVSHADLATALQAHGITAVPGVNGSSAGPCR